MGKWPKTDDEEKRGEVVRLEETSTSVHPSRSNNDDGGFEAWFFKTPVRFGNIPVDTLPLGCDEKEQYRKIYPKISLPFQIVERISFGHNDLEPNKLFFGDNLHIMRSLPSNSIDLIYIDPPFFSGKDYNVVFGDQNEVRSFTDIWEGGMPGYLTWLNARLLEMKRLLKPTGVIVVHLDWHAVHYVKVELDKIFGYENFICEFIWRMFSPHVGKGKLSPAKVHQNIIAYSKVKDNYNYYPAFKEYREYYKERARSDPDGRLWVDQNLGKLKKETIDQLWKEGRIFKTKTGNLRRKQYFDEMQGEVIGSVITHIERINSQSNERVGYDTQKPEELVKILMDMFSKEGDIVADFFMGGGTTPSVAQRLGRRWIASDISRIAVEVTKGRILRLLKSEKGTQKSFDKVPNIEVWSWGFYDAEKLQDSSESGIKIKRQKQKA